MNETGADLVELAVVAGVLVDGEGRVLIAQRPSGKAFAGRWEFPGGKIDAGESAETALHRELQEELGITVLGCDPLLTVRHRYPGSPRGVRITAFIVRTWLGVPSGLDGQRLEWKTMVELPEAGLLEADRPIVTALVLPRHFVKVTSVERGLACCLAADRRAPIAWLFEEPPGAEWRDAMHVRGDLAFHRSTPPSSEESVAGWVVGGAADQHPRWRGALVPSVQAAEEAVAAGADFLLVIKVLHARDRVAIACLGLPWYAVSAPGEDSQPTGILDWSVAEML